MSDNDNDNRPSRRQSDVCLAKLTQKVDDLVTTTTKIQEDQQQMLSLHDREIFGHKEYPGVKGDIGKLKQTDKRRTLREMGMFTALVGFVIDFIHRHWPS